MYGKVIQSNLNGVVQFDVYDIVGVHVGRRVVRAGSPVSLKQTKGELYAECSGCWINASDC